MHVTCSVYFSVWRGRHLFLGVSYVWGGGSPVAETKEVVHYIGMTDQPSRGTEQRECVL